MTLADKPNTAIYGHGCFIIKPLQVAATLQVAALQLVEPRGERAVGYADAIGKNRSSTVRIASNTSVTFCSGGESRKPHLDATSP